jgi:hypothetical protein
MASGVVKKCAICGRIYNAYGVADVEETELEGDPITEDDILNDETEYIVFKKDPEHPGEETEVNGIKYLTISERMDIQDQTESMDLCQVCRNMHTALISAIKAQADPTIITGAEFEFTVEQ